MKNSVLLVSSVIFAAAPALAQTPAPAGTPAPTAVTDPQQFVEMATVSNMFEIQSSELALEKTQLETVQDFAEHMIEDHTAAAEDMQAAVAEQGGLTPPTALDDRHRGMLTELEAANGEAFDALYIQMQTQAHAEAVSLFQSFAEGGPDGPLQDFAEETLPTLEEHYEEIQGVAVE